MSYYHISFGILLLSITSNYAMAAPTILSEQAELIPDEFQQHFFNVPLSAKITLNGRILGDAMVTLTEDNKVSLLQFTDSMDSDYPESDRQHWLKALSEPIPLTECDKRCPSGLMAAHYSLSDSRLALITSDGSGSTDYWHTLPEEGDSGLLLNNQLNISSGEQQTAMSWNGGLEAALGKWTLTSQLQYDRTQIESGGTTTSHAMTSLYAQREFQQHFLRLGEFTPDSQGLLRQPYLANGGVSTLAGVMAGSSDALLKGGNVPALYPVYVTANREGVAEVYRDGSLIHTQPLEPGLQLLDTTPLPAGIYDVEIRVLEDGRETSRTMENINKPSQWRTPGQRLRYNIFAGRQHTLWNSYTNHEDEKVALGSSINYLLLPQITTGLALQKVGSEKQAGVSVDWQVAEPVQLYGNLWNSNVTGTGMDSQAIWTHKQGNVSLNHSRSWYRPDDTYSSRPSIAHNTTASTTWRFNGENSLNVRVNRNSRTGGTGVDLGFNTRTTVMGTPVNWRLASFDRPYGSSNSNLRNRGVSLNASFPLSGKSRSGSLSMGSRTDSNGGRDMYASASVNQQWAETSPITSTTMSVTGDRYGVGLSTYNQFDTSLAQGSVWGQRSSQSGKISGGINTGSLLAIGKGGVALSKQTSNIKDGGMIINVSSDDDSVALQALSLTGTFPLKAGQNFIPIEAWRPGSVQIDVAGSEAKALKVEPEYLSYHHIPGGVSTHDVRVMKTITVIGRIVDEELRALSGARVVNHAGRTVSQPDGMFTVEVHEHNPVITVDHASGTHCDIRLSPETQKKQDIIFAGNLVCDGKGQQMASIATPEGKGV